MENKTNAELWKALCELQTINSQIVVLVSLVIAGKLQSPWKSLLGEDGKAAPGYFFAGGILERGEEIAWLLRSDHWRYFKGDERMKALTAPTPFPEIEKMLAEWEESQDER